MLVVTNMATRRRHQENHNKIIRRRNNLKYFEKFLKIKAGETHRRRRGGVGGGKLGVCLTFLVIETKTSTK
jgi:hypothetical protein